MSESGPALAHIVADYFNCLIEQKLERKEALELALNYQETVLEGQRREEEDA